MATETRKTSNAVAEARERLTSQVAPTRGKPMRSGGLEPVRGASCSSRERRQRRLGSWSCRPRTASTASSPIGREHDDFAALKLVRSVAFALPEMSDAVRLGCDRHVNEDARWRRQTHQPEPTEQPDRDLPSRHAHGRARRLMGRATSDRRDRARGSCDRAALRRSSHVGMWPCRPFHTRR